MNILFFGDIVGRPGRRGVIKLLPELKREYAPDLVIANSENLAHGKGITTSTVSELRDVGMSVLTGGNHSFAKSEGFAVLDDPSFKVIRPVNISMPLPAECMVPAPRVPGRGFLSVTVGAYELLIVSLIGRVFFHDQYDDPFRAIDALLKDEGPLDFAPSKFLGTSRGKRPAVFVDFHAEATSEKVAMGHYLDGRVAAVVGTHTHVPTADARILPKGTAYISDVGMCGLKESVIGVDTEPILNKFLTNMPVEHTIAEHGEVVVRAVAVEIDGATGKAKRIEQILRETEV
ncbi:MAG: YmdB family metallophosphoesterase [Parcubacteria group bacterium]|nr:YmdB family metallophosphoesterase [Parcubacteria group bacterium]